MAYSRPGVYISERLLPPVLTGGVTANAAGAVVAPFAQGPETVTLVNSWYEFTKYFGGYNASYPATFQVGAYFANGGKELYVQRLLKSDAVAASVSLVDSGSTARVTVTSKNAGTDGNNLRVVVTAGSVASTYTLTLLKESGIANNITDDILLERYENVIFDDATSSDFGPTVINTVSPNISVAVIAGYAGQGIVSTTYPLTSGTNGSAVTSTDYTNYKSSGSSVFERFSPLDRPLVIFLPAIWATLASGEVAAIDAATSWAASNNGFVVVETDAALTVANAISAAGSLTDTSFGAVYYPHVYIADPVGRGTGSLRLIGPSGAVAGLVAITPACAFVAPWAAVIIGLLAGIICSLAVGIKYKLGFDDSLDVVGVHLIGGIWGSLSIGLFGTHVVNSIGLDGIFYGGGTALLGKQALGVGLVLGYSFIATLIIGFVLEKTIGFRVSREVEIEGIDLKEHAESAYELASSSRGGASL